MSTAITSAPRTQSADRFGTSYVNEINKEPLFDVCNNGCACQDEESTKTCWTGAVAPCCLMGTAAKMRKNKFTEEVGPCDGCHAACCGIFSFNCFSGSTGCGPLIGSCLAVQCIRLYKTEQLSDYIKYMFCLPCGACADYKSALSQVELNTNKM
jgi:hypothetical protein